MSSYYSQNSYYNNSRGQPTHGALYSSQTPAGSQQPGDSDKGNKRQKTSSSAQPNYYAATGQQPMYPGGQSSQGFRHPPTDLPPTPSPLQTSKKPARMTGTEYEFMPEFEKRLGAVERAVDGYVGKRAEGALAKSMLPGTAHSNNSRSGSGSSGKS